MVDALVSFVIERVGDYLIREAEFLREVKGQVESLKKELEWMHGFINDAQKKQINDDLIRRWVLDMMDIAYDCEDVLDEFIIEVQYKGIPGTLRVHQTSTLERWQRLFVFLKKFSCIICSKTQEQIHLYGIGKQIESLKGRLDDLFRRRQLYNLENINNITEGESSARDRLRDLRRISSFQVEEINVVGFKDDTRTLLDRLLDKSKPQRLVISIFGTGGLGKTTLAGKLYHHAEIKNSFTHRAWVSVSQDYNTRDLLQRIINSFNKDRDMPKHDMKCEEEMERYLRQDLEGKSYLVVVDDIWHKEAWDCLKRAFPDENNGSRVIMTTRKRDIAERVDDNIFPCALQFLGPDESWELFRKKAFKNSNVDQGSEELGKEMVRKCGGLPLAIVVLGGLLSQKELKEWSKIRNQMWNNMVNRDTQIEYLLALSFDDLPSELKVCFLYMGLFPEDFKIRVRELIRLWVAEGLISQKGEKIMEELAEDYLDRLINRSLIQIGQTRRGRISTCQVHDLLRDLAIRKAKELNFISTNHDENSVESSTSRRQAFYVGTNTSSHLQHCHPLSRSVSFFGQHSLSSELLIPEVCTRFRLLRVLNIRGCIFFEPLLPEAIGMLIHLKYLGLRYRYPSRYLRLPSSIGKLLSLQTLDLPKYSPDHIPSEIGNLTELRHLTGHFDRQLPVDNLTKLQTLKNLHSGVWTQVNTEKLVNLRELTITSFFDTEKDEFTFDSIANLKSLRILSISLEDNIHFGSLEPLSNCKHLYDLNLAGKMQKLPENLHKLVSNLEFLSLYWSQLEDDPMPKLEKLLSLTHLELDLNSYRGSKMKCSVKGFPRLEILNLYVRATLEEWEVEEGAMPMLRYLKIPGGRGLTSPTVLSTIDTLKLSAGVRVEYV